MWKYIAKRLAMVSVVIAGVTLIAFSAMYLAPGDPAEVIALARYGEDLSASQIGTLREAEGLDAPVHIQYLIWVGHLLRLDLGKSTCDLGRCPCRNPPETACNRKACNCKPAGLPPDRPACGNSKRTQEKHPA